jgi:Ca2+-binding RTX toxin-like protein
MLNRMFTYVTSRSVRRARSVAVVTSGALFAGLMVTIGAGPSVAQSVDPTVLCGMCLTEPAAVAVSVTGSSKLTVNGGGVYANSNAAPAVSVTGSSKIVTNAQVRAVGTIVKTGSSTISGTPAAGLSAPLFADPYPGRSPVLSVGPNNATTDYTQPAGQIPVRADGLYRDVTLNGSGTFTFPDAHRYRDVTVGGSVTATLKPGRYRNITFGGSSKVTLLPGVYWLAGSLNVTSSSKVTGTDARLVLACGTAANDTRACNNETGGRILVTGSSQFTLNGNTPATPSISFAPGNNADLTIDGSSKLILANSGIDAPETPIVVTGSSSATTAGVIQARRVSVAGSSTITASVIPAPPATTTTTVAASTTTSTTTTSVLPTSTTTALPPTTTTPAVTSSSTISITTTSTTTTSTTTTTTTLPPEVALFVDRKVVQLTELCTTDANVIAGTDGNDTLIGTPGDDVICGFGGNDTLIGNGGDDTLIGGDGNDRLEGNDDFDELVGGAGDDLLIGGNGDDSLTGGFGTDVLKGDSGNDVADGGFGNDQLEGGPGADHLNGWFGDDLLDGGADSDILEGWDGSDREVAGAQVGDTCYNVEQPTSCVPPTTPQPKPIEQTSVALPSGSGGSVTVRSAGAFTPADLIVGLTSASEIGSQGNWFTHGPWSVEVPADSAVESFDLVLPTVAGKVTELFYRSTNETTWEWYTGDAYLDGAKVIVPFAPTGQWAVIVDNESLPVTPTVTGNSTNSPAVLKFSFGFQRFGGNISTQVAPPPQQKPLKGQPFDAFLKRLSREKTSVSRDGYLNGSFPLCVSRLFADQVRFVAIADTSGSTAPFADQIVQQISEHSGVVDGLVGGNQATEGLDTTEGDFDPGAFGDSNLFARLVESIGAVSLDEFRLRVVTVIGDGDLGMSAPELAEVLALAKAKHVHINYEKVGNPTVALSDEILNLTIQTEGKAIQKSPGNDMKRLLSAYVDIAPHVDADGLSDCGGEKTPTINRRTRSFQWVTSGTGIDFDGDLLRDDVELRLSGDAEVVRQSLKLGRVVWVMYSDPSEKDTDADGMSDVLETQQDLNPLKPNNPVDVFDKFKTVVFGSVTDRNRIKHKLDKMGLWDDALYGEATPGDPSRPFSTATLNGLSIYLLESELSYLEAGDGRDGKAFTYEQDRLRTEFAAFQMGGDTANCFLKNNSGTFFVQGYGDVPRVGELKKPWKEWSLLRMSRSRAATELKNNLNCYVEIDRLFTEIWNAKINQKVFEIALTTAFSIAAIWVLAGVVAGAVRGLAGIASAEAAIPAVATAAGWATRAASFASAVATSGQLAFIGTMSGLGSAICGAVTKWETYRTFNGLPQKNRVTKCPAGVEEKLNFVNNAAMVLALFGRVEVAPRSSVGAARPRGLDTEGVTNIERASTLVDARPLPSTESGLPTQRWGGHEGPVVEVGDASPTNPNVRSPEEFANTKITPVDTGAVAEVPKPQEVRTSVARLKEALSTCSNAASFAPSTLVLVNDGSYRRIDSLRVGDILPGVDETTGALAAGVLSGSDVHSDDTWVVETPDGSIRVTEDHLFWNADSLQWTYSSRTTAGRTLDRVRVPLKFRWDLPQTGRVVDISVAGTHNYFVKIGSTPVLVHNAGAFGCFKFIETINDLPQTRQDLLRIAKRLRSERIAKTRYDNNLAVAQLSDGTYVHAFSSAGGGGGYAHSEQKILRWVEANKPSVKIEAIFTERSTCVSGGSGCFTKLSEGGISAGADVFWSIPEEAVMFGEQVVVPTLPDGTPVTWKNNGGKVRPFLRDKLYPAVEPSPILSTDASGQN